MAAQVLTTDHAPPDQRAALVRSAWIVVAVTALGLFVAALPLRYAQLTHPPAAVRATIAASGLSLAGFALTHLALDCLFVGAWAAVGWIIFIRRRDDRTALLVALMLVTWAPMNGLIVLTPDAMTYPPAQILGNVLTFVAYMAWMLFFYLFPNGRFVPSWTRFTAGAWVVFVVLWVATPIGPPHWPGPLFGLAIAVLWGSFLVSQVFRYLRASSHKERQQTKWVVLGISVAVAGFLTTVALVGAPADLEGENASRQILSAFLSDGFMLLIPITIGIAVLRYRLFDIDLIINRALVYAGLTALVVGGYVLIVGSLSTLFQTHGSLAISLLATGVVAVLFQPLRGRLQRGVNRLLYGDRDDPYAVLSRLGRRLEAALAPDDVLPAAIATVSEALKLRYVAVILQGDSTPIASVGEPVPATTRLPLSYAGDPIGELLLSTRAPGEEWTASDRRLLGDLAHQVGTAVHSVRLTADLRRLTVDLQRSREGLVLAREEERRRLRRDLHDDLAPTLAALALSAAAAADLIESDPVLARRMVGDLTSAIRETVANIRRLVYDLRPPALDELGLVGAIRERVARYDRHRTATADQLIVTVDAPEHLPSLSAASEAAAYRIVQEALMNVSRHARARYCQIALSAEGAGQHGAWLAVTVIDDGVGLPWPETGRAGLPGIGLRSMQERAAELGGSCIVERAPTGGTRVRTRLPAHAMEQEHLDGASAGPDR